MIRNTLLLLCVATTFAFGFSLNGKFGDTDPTDDFLIGDFNLDGDRNGKDIDILAQSGNLLIGYTPGPDELVFDLDFNNVVNIYDMAEWLDLGIRTQNGPNNNGTVIGDADLDGDVDREDLDILNRSRNDPLTEPGKYTLGDFDGNGSYDSFDVFLWNRAFGTR